MIKYVPIFTEISSWNKEPFSNTGGTRLKNIYSPVDSNEKYFFKGSKKAKDGTLRYPMEFWSEIAASKIGQYFCFDILDYNIAYDENAIQKVGCISKSMIQNGNTLTEGIEYLRGYDRSYNPEKDEDRYTFDFINKSLFKFNIDLSEKEIIKIMIFDALIGNSDRHQENWGIITDYKKFFLEIESQLEKSKTWNGRLVLWYKNITFKGVRIKHLDKRSQGKKQSAYTLYAQSLISNKFSPIYDSGCCLGRENDENRITELISDENKLLKYIANGKAEIRFSEGRKPSHQEVLNFLLKEHPKLFLEIQSRIRKIFNENDLRQIVYNLDARLPQELKEHKLSDNRKELMIKLVTLRTRDFLNLK